MNPGDGSGPIIASFERRVRDRPHALAVWSVAEGLRISFLELEERVAAWERSLAELPRTPAALATGNVSAFIELFLALRRQGVPVVSLDAELPFDEKIATCRRLGVETLLHRDARDPPGARREESVQVTRIADSHPTPLPEGTEIVKITSGTSGAPIGACFREAALEIGVRQIAEAMEIDADDRVLISIPLSHSYGFDSGVLSLAVLGTPLVLQQDYFPRAIVETLRESGATLLPTVPPIVRALAEADWPQGLPLRKVISAAGPLDDATAQRFAARARREVHQFYGATETGGISFERHPTDPDATGTVGTPLPGLKVDLAPDGRVLVDSPASRHALLSAAIAGELGSADEVSRIVATGDTGEWAPGGRLRLTGRTSDVLKIGGRKVHTSRIEAALKGLAGVEDVAVVGVDDPARGERAVAFVVASLPQLDTRSLPPELAPKEVRRLYALPYNARGKLDRKLLARMARQPPRSISATALDRLEDTSRS